MLLNRLEFAMMNNPVRAALQRRFEARRLLRMGGPMRGGAALEIGCGRGVGVGVILDLFGADRVDAFDLDPRMVARARRRHAVRGARVHLWVGDAGHIAARDDTYAAVFDFGIIHHVPDWSAVLCEVARVLAPGGRFYAEEVLAGFTLHPVVDRLFEHPRSGRFDAAAFGAGLRAAGLEVCAARQMGGSFAWFVADKPAIRAAAGA